MTRSRQDILDELLVLKCQGQDTSALRQLVERYHQRIWRHALHLTGMREGAEEVSQETWLAIVGGLAGLRDPAAFRPWAYRLVARRSADWIRRRRRDRAHLSHATDINESPSSTESASQSDEDDVSRLRRSIRALPAHLRSVLWMHYRDELSVREIAYALGVPPGTVKSRLHQARRVLRDALERKQP